MKKILILGGSRFIGRNLVTRLLQEDHEIYLFNRNISNPNLIAGTQLIQGDRSGKGLEKLSKHDWDYIIDVSCYFPKHLELVLEHLSNIPENYIFVSTCSVYLSDKSSVLHAEESEIHSCTTVQSVNTDNSTYGNRKAECERILQASGLNHLIIRPALVYGPYDYTDRFYYWLHQVKRYQEIIIPESGKNKFSVTYVDDLVWMINQGILNNLNSVINAVSTPEFSIRQLIRIASRVMDKSPKIHNAGFNFLNQHHISQWSDMPLYIHGNHFTYSNEKIKTLSSFKATPLEETFAKTIAHSDKMNWRKPVFGISRKKQLELLDLINIES